jgi:hypothetical protein
MGIGSGRDFNDDPLRLEEAFFEVNRMDWLQDHAGEFALIKGKTLHGFFASEADALEMGLKCVGFVDMLIKEVVEKDPILRGRMTSG